MLAVGLGILVAITYGSADFFGGLASRRRSATIVVLWTQATGLVGLVLVVPLLGGTPTARDLGLGVLAGFVGLCGVLLLYRGLAVGRMSVVAPITAVGAAFVPFVAGLAGGESLPSTRLAGAAAALGGVILVSRASDPTAQGAPEVPRTGPRRDLALGAGAGAAFGIVFVLLAGLGGDAGLWPVLVQRLASVPAVVIVTLASRQPRRVDRVELRLIVPAGVCDAAANALFVAAARAGALSVVGVVSSLYPAMTVLLAAVVLKERVTRLQGFGLVLAAAGVVLLAL